MSDDNKELRVGQAREHKTDGSPCWCNPTVEKHDGGNVIIHNGDDGLARSEPCSSADLTTRLREALEEAKAGLRWYQEMCPQLADGSDDEAMARIDGALAQAEQTDADPTVSLSEYNRLQALVTSQGIRLMEYESENQQPAAPEVK